ncbi:MAG TPA: hypothetical protein VI818_04645 [Candidatus Thermoplasmatota archaeon]|nr:hypothetical protein [Candidatus Thermoplasmatota archaeon]
MAQIQGFNSRRWEFACLCAGAAWLALSAFAVFTPYLSGPLFGAVGILLGAFTVYFSGLFLWGASRDQNESMDETGVYGHLA